jgi:hypothetical protein
MRLTRRWLLFGIGGFNLDDAGDWGESKPMAWEPASDVKDMFWVSDGALLTNSDETVVLR